MVKYINETKKVTENQLNATFGALSDATRRAILARLAEGEEQVTELARPFGMSLPAISKHLKVLENARLITRRKDGRIHRFTVNPETMRDAQQWIETYQRFWEESLDALGDFLQQTSKQENNDDDDC